jgi:hypothetical protein
VWRLASSAGPTSRYSASLAYDAARGNYVLFGGESAHGSSDETWVWDGKAWDMRSPAHKPPARRAAGMAYDPAHKVVVLYGGRITDQVEGHSGGDTWTWDGTDWTAVGEAPGPPDIREGPVLITAGDRVVLFGGHNFNTTYWGDAYSWDGTTWHRIDKEPRPPARGNAAAVWNPEQQSLFVFGGTGFNPTAGIGAQGLPLKDAWSLSGSTWQQISAPGPPALTFANAIWDGGHKSAVVLLGINCPKPSGDAWSWDGNAWSRRATAIPPRWGSTVAQSPDGKGLLFGGSDEAGC